MIQVCSQCGTRWNVRDRQREWCPRCRGRLAAPSSETPRSIRAGVPALGQRQRRGCHRAIAGLRFGLARRHRHDVGGDRSGRRRDTR